MCDVYVVNYVRQETICFFCRSNLIFAINQSQQINLARMSTTVDGKTVIFKIFTQIYNVLLNDSDILDIMLKVGSFAFRMR